MPHRRVVRLVVAIVAAASIGTSGCMWYLRPQCNDLVKNGEETDVDCGGGTCKPCALHQSCAAATDCYSAVCTAGKCVPPPCENGVRDGDETDVDCGGPTCRKCAGARDCRANTDCFGGSCDSTTSTCSSLRTVSFAAADTYAAAYKTYALFSADLNGDGWVDLVAANEQDDSYTVLLGRGDGTFARSDRNYPTGAYPTGGTIADLNGDGILDVVTADYHGNSVSVSFGFGDGTFFPPAHYATAAGAQTSNLAVGDLNGDHALDILATNPAGASVSLFLNRGDGTFHPAVTIPVGIRGAAAPFSAAIGDFDGDGKNDVAIGDVTSGSIVVRLGNGDGSFGPEVAYREGGVGPYICIVHDMDLDGRLDIVCANRESDDVTVLLGRGDGTFAEALVSTTGAGTGPYAIAVADFNQDGVPDVVTPNFRASTASILLGIGDGRFEAPIDAGPTGDVSYGVVAADFDRDGRPDLAVCNAVSNDVTVKLNTSR